MNAADEFIEAGGGEDIVEWQGGGPHKTTTEQPSPYMTALTGSTDPYVSRNRQPRFYRVGLTELGWAIHNLQRPEEQP